MPFISSGVCTYTRTTSPSRRAWTRVCARYSSLEAARGAGCRHDAARARPQVEIAGAGRRSRCAALRSCRRWRCVPPCNGSRTERRSPEPRAGPGRGRKVRGDTARACGHGLASLGVEMGRLRRRNARIACWMRGGSPGLQPAMPRNRKRGSVNESYWVVRWQGSGHSRTRKIGHKRTVSLTARRNGDSVSAKGPKECDPAMTRLLAVVLKPQSAGLRRLADTHNRCRHNFCRPNRS